jgi:predicted DNA-binding protein
VPRNSKGDSRKEQPSRTRSQIFREAIELYLETLPDEERDALLSREILTTSVEVRA